MKSEGKCRFCSKVFSGRGMELHLKSCSERTKAHDNPRGEAFLIKASAGPFFVFFEIDSSSKLDEMDQFLRDLWLECCGHLSAFKIGEMRYSSYHELDYGEQTMDIQVRQVLKPGINFMHEYDFGTTTELEMKCISKRYAKIKEIKILARNDMPDFRCKCGKPAKDVCAQCVWEGKGFLCKACAKEHKCGDEGILPIVNSPRIGMCGFTGEECRLLGK